MGGLEERLRKFTFQNVLGDNNVDSFVFRQGQTGMERLEVLCVYVFPPYL